MSGAKITDESKTTMSQVAGREAARFVLKDEEGARFFIIDNSRPTETWRLGLAELSWAQEMVDLANRAHQAELMAAQKKGK